MNKTKFPPRDLPPRPRAQNSSSQTQGAIPGQKTAMNYEWFFFHNQGFQDPSRIFIVVPTERSLGWAEEPWDGSRTRPGTVTPSSSGTCKGPTETVLKSQPACSLALRAAQRERAAESWPAVLQSQWLLPTVSKGSTWPFASCDTTARPALLPPFPIPLPARGREKSTTEKSPLDSPGESTISPQWSHSSHSRAEQRV